MQPVRVTFLGFGLIGGSVAIALREAGGWTAAAWSPSGAGPARALEAGVVDAAPSTLDDALADADLVVLAAPPTACLALLDRLAGESIEVERFSVHTPDLDDVFLAVTGRPRREEVAIR